MPDRARRETTERWYWDVEWPRSKIPRQQVPYRLGDTLLDVLQRVVSDAARTHMVDVDLIEHVSCRLVKP